MDAARGQNCARTRFWVSLRLDGELSELEGALLDAHLARCESCSAFAQGSGVVTRAIRDEPFAAHAPVAAPRRSAPRRTVYGALAAAIVVLAGVLGGQLGSRGELSGTPGSTRVVVVASPETPDQLRELRRTQLLSRRPLVPRDLAVEPA